MGVPLTVNIPASLDEKFKAMARDRLISKSDVVREALLEHVKKNAPESKKNIFVFLIISMVSEI